MTNFLIAIPGFPSLNNPGVIEARQAYANAIIAAGGTPLILPPTTDAEAARRMWQACRGLLLIGGGDLEAWQYGAPDSGKLTYVSPERDRLELQFARWALAQGAPILGICRGIQALNVAAGGTLVQDIPSEVPNALSHAVSYQSGEGYAHGVDIKPGTLLSRSLGVEGLLRVNSHHHQSVKRVAAGFLISATAADGVVEAIELPSARFVLGVQWHPEGLVPDDAAAVRLFSSFVEACG